MMTNDTKISNKMKTNEYMKNITNTRFSLSLTYSNFQVACSIACLFVASKLSVDTGTTLLINCRNGYCLIRASGKLDIAYSRTEY